MSDVRKVVGDLIEAAKNGSSLMPLNSKEFTELLSAIAGAEPFLTSLPASGDAWYPEWEEVVKRCALNGDTFDRFTNDACIRATADLIRERGGQAGGDVVGWQFSIQNKPFGVWSGWIDCPQSEAQHLATQSGFKVRELIARQQTNKESLSVAQPVQEVPGRVVAVPDGLIEYLEVLRGDPSRTPRQVHTDRIDKTIEILKSLQGAGHEQRN